MLKITKLKNYICTALLEKTRAVQKFGYQVVTSNGIIPYNNTWTDDWIVN